MKVYHSEAAKFRELDAMKYVVGLIADMGCGDAKITPDAIGYDGRPLEGVDVVGMADHGVRHDDIKKYDTIFSSHFLEHCVDPYYVITNWLFMLKEGGHLVLYLPDGDHYNNRENPEHMVDMKHDPFVFWIKRALCGEGKDFKGNHLTKRLDFIESGMDLRENCYSFYVVLRKA